MLDGKFSSKCTGMLNLRSNSLICSTETVPIVGFTVLDLCVLGLETSLDDVLSLTLARGRGSSARVRRGLGGSRSSEEGEGPEELHDCNYVRVDVRGWSRKNWRM